HFNTNHGRINNDFPIGSEVCAFKVKILKSQFVKQTQAFSKFAKESENVTLALYQVAWNIDRAKKSYSEGDFMKTCLTDVAAILCPENSSLQKQISEIQLSRHTIERRISDLSSDVELQLHSAIQTCACLNIAINESCAIQDKPQLPVFACIVSDDCKIKEELLDIVALKGRTRGVDIKQALMSVLEEAKLPLQKLTAIATDRVPAMLGSVSGLVWDFVKLRKAFLNFAEVNDKELPGDLALHCAVCWLSRGKVINRFFELLNPPELTDSQWVLDLAFLADILSHLDKLNLDLQGKVKMLLELTQSMFAFINKLKLFRDQMEKDELTHFPSVTKAQENNDIQNSEQCATSLKGLEISFLVDLFSAESERLKPPLVNNELASQLEIIELHEDDGLKLVLKEGILEFWKICCSLPDFYVQIYRQYVRESLFSSLKLVKSKYRSLLTYTHISELLHSSITEYKPHFMTIVGNKECQKS
uniref:Uncharacterized protein n=1 Tax=Latimeria chalumnae TaxID=7897 RepID=H3AFK5_LATCH